MLGTGSRLTWPKIRSKKALVVKLQQKMVIETIEKDVVEIIGVKTKNTIAFLLFQHKLFQDI